MLRSAIEIICGGACFAAVTWGWFAFAGPILGCALGACP